MPSRRLITASERSKLEPFVVATGDASPRDQRDLMERPFSSLAKARRTAPILYEAAGVRVEVFAVREHGMATIAKRKRVLFVLSLQNGRAMVGGHGTAADAAITLAGAVNAAEAIEGFKPMTNEAVIAAAPDVILKMLILAAPFLARGLNALALGEAEAFHLGVRVQRLKAAITLLVAIAVGASVATAGVIGFMGIVAPHLLRLGVGPEHRALLPLSAVLGAILVAGADVLARVLVAPAELPIGILTAAVGAPFFLWLLLRGEGSLR